ncbi:MAG: HAD-IIB family hydrolase [Bdellovibrionales bacterium]|nr:HAD-IIB family hydrolase [Bdellovibrionales bacterium]
MSSARKTSPNKPPLPVSRISRAQARRIRYLFFDIDDTLTLEGKLPWQALRALWRAKEKLGWKVVPVTGRPAGWVDHIARMWPVDGVVGENGGFYFHLTEGGRDGRLMRHFLQPEEARRENRAKLLDVFTALRKEMPHLRLAGDQPYREIDVAIDICEEVEALSTAEVDRVVKAFRSAGAQSKISSIHVNSWFGTHDKLTTCGLFLQEVCGISFDDALDRIVYLGDSPNDEPMFSRVPLSLGVANVKRFLPSMQHPPRYLCRKPGGQGFAEAIQHLTELIDDNPN